MKKVSTMKRAELKRHIVHGYGTSPLAVFKKSSGKVAEIPTTCKPTDLTDGTRRALPYFYFFRHFQVDCVVETDRWLRNSGPAVYATAVDLIAETF